jgi:hypothetical protein
VPSVPAATHSSGLLLCLLSMQGGLFLVCGNRQLCFLPSACGYPRRGGSQLQTMSWQLPLWRQCSGEMKSDADAILVWRTGSTVWRVCQTPTTARRTTQTPHSTPAQLCRAPASLPPCTKVGGQADIPCRACLSRASGVHANIPLLQDSLPAADTQPPELKLCVATPNHTLPLAHA